MVWGQCGSVGGRCCRSVRTVQVRYSIIQLFDYHRYKIPTKTYTPDSDTGCLHGVSVQHAGLYLRIPDYVKAQFLSQCLASV